MTERFMSALLRETGENRRVTNVLYITLWHALQAIGEPVEILNNQLKYIILPPSKSSTKMHIPSQTLKKLATYPYLVDRASRVLWASSATITTTRGLGPKGIKKVKMALKAGEF